MSPTECQGGSERPCSGNGQCSGDGSRQGDGSCQCHLGYQGTLCTDCVDGYFSSLRNETHSICTGTAGTALPPGAQKGLFPELPAGHPFPQTFGELTHVTGGDGPGGTLLSSPRQGVSLSS